MQYFEQMHISMVPFQDTALRTNAYISMATLQEGVTVMQQGSFSLFFKNKNFGIIWAMIRFLNFHVGSKTNIDIINRLPYGLT